MGIDVVNDGKLESFQKTRKMKSAVADSCLAALRIDTDRLRHVVLINDHLGALVLAGASAEEITGSLSRLTGRRARLLSPMLRLLPNQDAGEWAPAPDYVLQALPALAKGPQCLRIPPMPEQDVLDGCLLSPVICDGKVHGYLAVDSAESTIGSNGGFPISRETECLIVQYASTLCSIAISRDRLAENLKRDMQGELLQVMLAEKVTDARLEDYGQRLFPGDGGLRILAIGLEDPEETGERLGFLNSIAEAFHQIEPAGVITRVEDVLVGVVQAEKSEITPMVRALQDEAAAVLRNGQIAVGVSASCEGWKSLREAYREARKALEVSRRFLGTTRGLAFSEELGLQRLLIHSDSSELHSYAISTLGPLIDYDARKRTNFVETVESFIKQNTSVVGMAEEMHIHSNTAVYRIQRIKEITGLDLTEGRDLLAVRVALLAMSDNRRSFCAFNDDLALGK